VDKDFLIKSIGSLGFINIASNNESLLDFIVHTFEGIFVQIRNNKDGPSLDID
jgi:hypothetical protein